MSVVQTINDPENLRIKLSGKQIAGLVAFVFACGGYFTSLHFQVSGMRKSLEEKTPLIAQIPEIKAAVDAIPDLKRDVRDLRTQIQRNTTNVRPP